MLPHQDVGRFRAFGFVVLRNCLSEDEVDNLQRAHDRVIAGAPVYNYFAENGTRMLSPFVQADPSFADLIEHPGVMQAMRRIWGTECIYIAGSDMWANRDDTPWHTDGHPGRQTVTLKTAIYLDEQDEDQGVVEPDPRQQPRGVLGGAVPLLRLLGPRKTPPASRARRRSRGGFRADQARRRGFVGQPPVALRLQAR